MKFQFNNQRIENPFLKILIGIFALVIVVSVLGLVGLIFVPIAILVGIILIFVTLILPILLSFGAGRWMKGIRGSGEVLTEIRDVKPFTGISLGLPCEVEIQQAEEQEVTIETDDNILGYILSYVQDGILHINTKNILSPSKHIFVKIKTNQLSKLSLAGNAKVNLVKIKEESLKINISGTAKIMGNGKIDDLDIVISGMGSISFKEVKSRKARIKISGSGKAELYVEESLDASINGTGKATIWGKPANVSKSVNGLGKINIV